VSCTVTLGGVHLTHQPYFSLGAPICRGLVIEFTSTLLKAAGDPKSVGCEYGCDFSPACVIASGFGQGAAGVAAVRFLSNLPHCYPYAIGGGGEHRGG
jgi:hypothetical protein